MQLVKHESILDLIERLKLIIDFNGVKLIDYWEAELCAIGLNNGNNMVYISTWAYIEEETLMYDFDLEILEEKQRDTINVVKKGRNVSEAELVDEIRVFLGV